MAPLKLLALWNMVPIRTSNSLGLPWCRSLDVETCATHHHPLFQSDRQTHRLAHSLALPSVAPHPRSLADTELQWVLDNDMLGQQLRPAAIQGACTAVVCTIGLHPPFPLSL